MSDDTIPADRETMTWCIRHLPTDLVRRCARLAKSRDMLIGEWVTKALEAALEREESEAPNELTLAARVHQLEAEVRQLRETHDAQYDALLARVANLDGGPAKVADAKPEKREPPSDIPEPPGGFF